MRELEVGMEVIDSFRYLRILCLVVSMIKNTRASLDNKREQHSPARPSLLAEPLPLSMTQPPKLSSTTSDGSGARRRNES